MIEVRPIRLRLSRAKGFNLQQVSLEANGLPAIVVARPTKWGNPHDWRDWRENFPADMLASHAAAFRDEWCRDQATEAYAEDWRDGRMEHLRPALSELVGHNLACWCGHNLCHAMLLLRMANTLRVPS